MAKAKVKDSQVDSGDAASQSAQDDGDIGSQDLKGGDDKSSEGGGDDKGKKPDDQYVTPTALQGVIDAHKRTTQAELKKSNEKVDALTSTIDELKELIAGKKKEGDGDAGEDAGKKVDPEIAELRRRLDQAETKLKSEEQARASAEQKERDYRFESTVKGALVEGGCEAPDGTFQVIKPLLKVKEDGSIFATVTIDGGLETDVDLKTYIERYFSEDVYPYPFKGKMRSGSPASGDSGDSGGGGYDFTWEQVNDPKFYAENADRVRKAIEAGRVKGMPK